MFKQTKKYKNYSQNPKTPKPQNPCSIFVLKLKFIFVLNVASKLFIFIVVCGFSFSLSFWSVSSRFLSFRLCYWLIAVFRRFFKFIFIVIRLILLFLGKLFCIVFNNFRGRFQWLLVCLYLLLRDLVFLLSIWIWMRVWRWFIVHLLLVH